MAITALGALAAAVAVAGGLVAAARGVLKWRERRKYGPGPPQYDLSGRRVTWARRTGQRDGS